ncbi:hypothetical protein BP00DRAFT_391797 [Aspergillus indologenus CBS 114.80]|uniref:NADH dehydrogenase [ubiquinone] 1 alpha subcomplex subunit 13 n=1 Tax=Aspergillus indologenus CBS 114.80 TaxID=1450541 RepID=A0A2V5IAD5_9EURO|nr:hypothetical protein BP00DRAFT_391797 [Aspergillus indologenus CBS 114.80]
MPQDMPPAGGYHQVQYKRNVPVRGFRPIVYLAGMVGAVTYGLYKQYYSMREMHELGREKLWGRLHILPLLQAEEDRDQVRRYYADKAREQQLLGSENRVYNSDRFVRPTFAYTPSQVTE